MEHYTINVPKPIKIKTMRFYSPNAFTEWLEKTIVYRDYMNMAKEIGITDRKLTFCLIQPQTACKEFIKHVSKLTKTDAIELYDAFGLGKEVLLAKDIQELEDFDTANA